MRIIFSISRCAILNILLSCFITGLAFSVSADISINNAFEKRAKYKNETRLGNPDDAKKFVKRSENTSKLQSLKDSSLTSSGQNVLNNSEKGEFLQKTDLSRIRAVDRYKINSENPLLKASLKLEEGPLSKTGGSQSGSTIISKGVKTKKTCIEGVDFNVDVGIELILDVAEEEYLSPMKQEHRKIRFSGKLLHDTKMNWGFAKKWKRKRWGWHITPHHPVGRGKSQIDSVWKHNPIAILADARAYIAHHIQKPIEAVGENIIFPVCGRGVGNINPVGCRWRVAWDQYEFGYDYRFQEKLKRLLIKGEYWQVTTASAEKLADSNECYEVRRRCIKSGVKTFFGKYDVSRPCWYEKVTYACKSQPVDGCAQLIKQNCVLQDSKCEHKIGSLCMRWKRDYLCGGQNKELKFSLTDSPIYCLGGDCHTPTLEENQDFANVAYLAAANEAKKDCVKEANGLCKKPITVFPGKSESCKKIIVGLIDCCSSMKGWGKNANLCRCSGGEKGLALKKDKGLCHSVGTYCHKKDPVFGTCLVKKTSHCCFSSKLARIFHEQGRAQLGISWGSNKSPNCRPLTLKELTSLDFSKFDMEELFDALLSKGKQNANKNFPALVPGKIPDAQQEHMNINSSMQDSNQGGM